MNAPTKTEARKAIKLRAQGKTWAEVTEALGRPNRFEIALRPLMKEIDAESVRPSYDRKKAARKRAKQEA